jgi:hypothetical protein
MTAESDIINRMAKHMAFIRRKSIIINGTTGIIKPRNVTGRDILTKILTAGLIMKRTIAAGKKAMLNTESRTMIGIVTGRSIVSITTNIAVDRHERI